MNSGPTQPVVLALNTRLHGSPCIDSPRPFPGAHKQERLVDHLELIILPPPHPYLLIPFTIVAVQVVIVHDDFLKSTCDTGNPHKAPVLVPDPFDSTPHSIGRRSNSRENTGILTPQHYVYGPKIQPPVISIINGILS